MKLGQRFKIQQLGQSYTYPKKVTKGDLALAPEFKLKLNSMYTIFDTAQMFTEN